MKKYYDTFIFDIDRKGNIDLSILKSEPERNIVEMRDIIYIYKGKKDLYIGQTINFIRRHIEHRNNTEFDMRRYDRVIVLFGKGISGKLDYIEKSFISLFTADNEKGMYENRRKIRNKTLGNNSNYMEDYKVIDAEVIARCWKDELDKNGFVNNKDVTKLKNSILFKYSPFSNLTNEQSSIINSIVEETGNYLIEGGSGTGKTVVMTNLIAKISEKFDNTKKIAVVVKSNWKDSGKKIFSSYGIKNIDIGTWVEIVGKGKTKTYDYIIIDEAHRLAHRHGYQMANELKVFKEYQEDFSLNLLKRITNSLVLFYDRFQTIRPADIPQEFFFSFIKRENFKTFYLKTQFRISFDRSNPKYKPDDYIKGIQYVLQISNDKTFNKELFNDPCEYSYFGIVDSIEQLFKYIYKMDNILQDSQNRVLAGYAREWKSKNDVEAFDWVEGNNHWKWNSTSRDWMNTENSQQEIGSIHAVQGIDINCVGVILGKDIAYRNGKIVGIEQNYYDKFGKPRKDKEEEKDLASLLKDIYYVLMTRGIDGIRLYIEDENLKQHFINTLGITKAKVL